MTDWGARVIVHGWTKDAGFQREQSNAPLLYTVQRTDHGSAQLSMDALPARRLLLAGRGANCEPVMFRHRLANRTV